MLKNIEQFNDFEKSIMTYQDHALAMNEFKTNGVSDISIDTYLSLIESIVTFLHQFDDYVSKQETTIENQKEQIDKLLDRLNKNITI